MLARTDGTAREREPWHARLRLRPLADWITLGEAAEDLGISREAVHRLVQRGTLKARTVGRRPVIVVSRRDIQALPVSPQRRREMEKDVQRGVGRRAPRGVTGARSLRAVLPPGLPQGSLSSGRSRCR